MIKNLIYFLILAIVMTIILLMAWTISQQEKTIKAYDRVINEIPDSIFLDVIAETDAWQELQDLQPEDTTCK